MRGDENAGVGGALFEKDHRLQTLCHLQLVRRLAGCLCHAMRSDQGQRSRQARLERKSQAGSKTSTHWSHLPINASKPLKNSTRNPCNLTELVTFPL